MRTIDLLRTGRARRRWRMIAAVVVGLFAGTRAGADDPVYYSRGKVHQLHRSTNEFGVKLQDRNLEAQVGAELRVRSLGSLQPLDRGQSEYRLLRVGATNEPTRAAAAQVPGLEWVRPVYRFEGGDSPALSTGRIAVRVVPELTPADAADLFSGYGLSIAQAIDGLNNTFLVVPDDDLDGADVAAAAALYADGRVVYAHPDFVIAAQTRQVTPQDEFFSQQWHLNNTGQGGGTSGADTGVLDAWTVTQGEDVIVGVLDDCCDVAHEDLRDNYLNVGQDIIDGDSDPSPAQIGERHGTSVTGLIVAAGNTSGVRGVAPNARFTVTRGLVASNSLVASAYLFARQNNVDVHNNSWGFAPGTPIPDIIADGIKTAFEDGRDGKGMVICFASGNDGRDAPDDISALPWVIAVGATNADDQLTSYSNFGVHLDIVAPSNPGLEGFGLPSMVTVDNTDDAGFAEPGYNFAGLNDFGLPNLPNPDYTDDFGGTSAACPMVVGVAALVLSVNPELTATQVRVLLEHTADKVSPADAAYDGVTSRSNTYGYGRVNAEAAVIAAQESLTNQNLTWPDRVSNVSVTGSTLRWTMGSEATNLIIARGDSAFQWVPSDGVVYQVDQEVTDGVTIAFKDVDGEAASYDFLPPDFGTTFFGIYAQNDFGRYSWGVLVDSQGNVTDAGPAGTGGVNVVGGDPDAVTPINDIPAVSVDVSPRSGVSPLTVDFQGNALTNSEIVEVEWNFGDGTPPVNERDISHTYIVTDGTTTRFVAVFSVVDAEGDTGSRSVAIDVTSSSPTGGDSGINTGTVEVLLTDAGGQGIDAGFAPLDVRLTVDTRNLPGDFNSIFWDLGDGTTGDTLVVLHTYENNSGESLHFLVTATVTTCSPAPTGCRTTSNPNGITWQNDSPPKSIEVLPSLTSGVGGDGPVPVAADDDQPLNLNTGRNAGAGAICGLGLMPLWLALLGLAAVRRWVN